MFVCQDADHRSRFLHAADYELTGHLSTTTYNGREQHYTARDRILLALESDLREGITTAVALPAVPPRREQRENPARVRRVALPGLDG